MSEEEHLIEDVSLLSIPNEVLELILENNVLSYKDLVGISTICKQLHIIALSSKIWRRHAMNRWSNWNKELVNSSPDWYTIFAARHLLELQLNREIHAMNQKWFDYEFLPTDAFKPFQVILEADEYDIAEHTLCELLTQILCNTSHENLTLKYYGKKVYNHVLLAARMKKLMALPEDQVLIEDGAIIISSWLSTSTDIVDRESIHGQLDKIAARVRHALDCSGVLLCHYRVNTDGYVTDWYYCREVLLTMNQIIYRDLGFRGNRENRYDEGNTYIDQVLKRKTGIPISLCAVYLAVARRLNVKLEPIGFPGHFLLRIPSKNDESKTSRTYIDAFNNGELMDEQGIMVLAPFELASIPEALQPVTNLQIMVRMVRNLTNIFQNNIRRRSIMSLLISSLHLTLLLCPEDEEVHSYLSRVYQHYGIYDEQLVESAKEKAANGVFNLSSKHLQSIELLQELKNKPNKHKPKIKRCLSSNGFPRSVQYKVGMIMQHLRYNYNCVIYGWDDKCKANPCWITQMGIHMLPNGTEQPFYNVLAADLSYRYAAQENLKEIEDECEPSPHPEVGKYFQSFDGRKYVPNDELNLRYPDD